MNVQKCPVEYWFIDSNGQSHETDLFSLRVADDFSIVLRQRIIQQLKQGYHELLVECCEQAGVELEGQWPQVHDFDAEGFHRQLQRIEKRLGRRRAGVLNEPRIIDLDLLYFGHKKISTSVLKVPHPRAKERRFVLLPLSEIASEMVLPGQDLSVIELLNRLPQTPMVRVISG